MCEFVCVFQHQGNSLTHHTERFFHCQRAALPEKDNVLIAFMVFSVVCREGSDERKPM